MLWLIEANIASTGKLHLCNGTPSRLLNFRALTDSRPNSEVLFRQGSEQSYYEMQVRKEIAIQNWDATLDFIVAGRKEENIRRRLIIGEAITQTRSKTEFERQSLGKIERQVLILMALEERLKGNSPNDDGDLKDSIDLAIRDVDHPGVSLTLAEVMRTNKQNGTGVNGSIFQPCHSC